MNVRITGRSRPKKTASRVAGPIRQPGPDQVGHGPDQGHGHQVQLVLGGQARRADQGPPEQHGDLAGDGHAGRFEHHEQEDRDVSVPCDLLRDELAEQGEHGPTPRARECSEGITAFQGPGEGTTSRRVPRDQSLPGQRGGGWYPAPGGGSRRPPCLLPFDDEEMVAAMTKTLVVVESPTKAKTLERYLGPEYTVRASYGHIRDLPKSKLGVDTEREFEPEYVVPEDSEKHVRALRAALKKTDDLVLATDFDREGEAIAYHVAEVLKVDPAATKRVTFTEITRDAILEAFQSPRAIDLRLVEAQQARRILDRLVGYRLSPVLWKKVRPGLSAGRVQSVALRLIVDRDREIAAFVPVEYWSVDVRLTPEGDEAPFVARLIEIPEGKLAPSPDKKGITLSGEPDAALHADRLREAAYRVREVREKEVKRNPAPPFTTSTLQQEAARKLGFGARRTMRLAQQLYEGIELPGEGRVGLITYMRTDSTTIAESALREIAEVVKTEFGAAYALKQPRRYKTKQRGAQEAHEAIRPTSAMRTPDRVAGALDKGQQALYRLIWQRTVASQMAEARFDQVSVADEDAESSLPRLTAEQVLRFLEVLPEQHFTQPPPRFTEASLVKVLEELGIGRPSTYASIISTLQDRGYVRLEERRFFPEDVGEVVTDLLKEFFPDVVDVNFTAKMEEDLDEIAEGTLRWVQVLDEFYGPFERLLEKNEGEIQRFEEVLDETCPLCPKEGRDPGQLVIKLGRYGKFIGCSNWPDCSYIRNIDGQERKEPEVQ